MTIKFQGQGQIKHDRVAFHPGVPYGFEDQDAEPYFKAAFGAEDTDDEPSVIFTQDEVSIDPDTIFGGGPNKGEKVLVSEAPADPSV